MKTGGRLLWSARGAAFLAVALLSFASIQSIVMQAQAAATAGMPFCSADGSGTDRPGRGDGPYKSASAVCSFCVAAAHAPLIATAEPPPAPLAVRWAAAPPVPTRSPCGLQTIRPKARGPPILPQDV